MVQLSLALACLLAGADAFAPIPTKVPHHTHEEPDTHEVPHHTHESESPPPSASPSPAPSAPVVIVPKFKEHQGSCTTSEDNRGPVAKDLYSNADDCWNACEKEAAGEQNNNILPSTHVFRVTDKTTECQCQLGCDCWNAPDGADLAAGSIVTLAKLDWEPPLAQCIPVIVPKFSVYKGSCDQKDLIKIMWDDGVTVIDGVDVGIVIDFPPYTINPSKPIITADDCWEACMAYGNDVFDGTIQDGTKPMQPTFSFQDDSAAQGGVKCFCMDCHHYVSADSESCWRAQDSDSILAEADWTVGTLSTLAAPDWTPPAACPVPFSKHQGVCGDSIAKISKGAEVISTATKCWEACEMYKFAEPAHIYDSINSSCECRDKCTCWEDSANEGQAAARFTTLALPDWVPPNPDPNTAAEWATIFTAGEMCDGSA